MPDSIALEPKNGRPVFWQRTVEPLLIAAMILFLALGWFVALRYQEALENAVIRSYQDTQLQIVRAVARSAAFFVQQELQQTVPVDTIEQELFSRFVWHR